MIVRRLACAAALLLAALRADAQTVRLRGTVVRLVMIAGLARYGDPQLMKVLAPNATLEPITVCGRAMLLNLNGTGQTWAHVLRRLTEGMRPIGMAPSALTTCSMD